jgi:hypothetical protein
MPKATQALPPSPPQVQPAGFLHDMTYRLQVLGKSLPPSAAPVGQSTPAPTKRGSSGGVRPGGATDNPSGWQSPVKKEGSLASALGLSPAQMKWLGDKLAKSRTIAEDLEDLGAISKANGSMDAAEFDTWLRQPENERVFGTYKRYILQAPLDPLDGIKSWYYGDKEHQTPTAIFTQLAVLRDDQKQELLNLALPNFEFHDIEALVTLAHKGSDPAPRRLIAEKLLHLAAAPQTFRNGPYFARVLAFQLLRLMGEDPKSLGARPDRPCDWHLLQGSRLRRPLRG